MAAVHSMRPKKQGPESLVLIAWIKRQLNRGSPSNETQKTKVDCHCRCSTIKVSPCSILQPFTDNDDMFRMREKFQVGFKKKRKKKGYSDLCIDFGLVRLQFPVSSF